jgi:hypothetical protein
MRKLAFTVLSLAVMLTGTACMAWVKLKRFAWLAESNLLEGNNPWHALAAVLGGLPPGCYRRFDRAVFGWRRALFGTSPKALASTRRPIQRERARVAARPGCRRAAAALKTP